MEPCVRGTVCLKIRDFFRGVNKLRNLLKYIIFLYHILVCVQNEKTSIFKKSHFLILLAAFLGVLSLTETKTHYIFTASIFANILFFRFVANRKIMEQTFEITKMLIMTFKMGNQQISRTPNSTSEKWGDNKLSI